MAALGKNKARNRPGLVYTISSQWTEEREQDGKEGRKKIRPHVAVSLLRKKVARCGRRKIKGKNIAQII